MLLGSLRKHRTALFGAQWVAQQFPPGQEPGRGRTWLPGKPGNCWLGELGAGAAQARKWRSLEMRGAPSPGWLFGWQVLMRTWPEFSKLRVSQPPLGRLLLPPLPSCRLPHCQSVPIKGVVWGTGSGGNRYKRRVRPGRGSWAQEHSKRPHHAPLRCGQDGSEGGSDRSLG